MNNDKSLIMAPGSWNTLSSHFKTALTSEWYQILTKLQDEFNYATVQFYRKKGFRFIQLPLTTGAISSPMGLGSDSKPVKITLAGVETYLADSMQFFLEYTSRIHQAGTYYIAPSFRGELADKRHLCQFYHSESEIVGDLRDIMDLCEDYLKYLTTHLLKTCNEDILKITGSTEHLEKFLENTIKNVPTCTFDSAVEILENNPAYIKDHGKYRVINSQGEKLIMKHFGGYVWLTHFDHLSVPFYQKFDSENADKALNADLLMGIGETIGCGQRHLTGTEVNKALKLHHVCPDSYNWYINLKDTIPVQTSGFGLGTERFFLWLLNHDDIRDMQLVPRFNGVQSPF